MSGGVDSSVAAFLTKKQGYDCIGAMMKLIPDNGKACCGSAEDAEDARRVADKIGIPFYVFNFTENFKKDVINRFIAAYQNGETPNPCIDCNRYLKFERFLTRASKLDMNYIVTGHYARICRENGRFLLKKALDDTKDQSYVLYSLTQKHLERLLLPLGELRKSETREIALEQGFINAKKKDSQDICFVPNGDYAEFIREYAGAGCPPGKIVDKDGNILGEHKGIVNYTIGQRKRLCLFNNQPLYVCDINAQNNTVTVGEEKFLFAKTLIANDINLIAVDKITDSLKVKAKIRYKHAEQSAVVRQTGEDELIIEFDAPQRAVTKGQAVALYDGDAVIGGGTIKRVIREE